MKVNETFINEVIDGPSGSKKAEAPLCAEKTDATGTGC